MLGALLPLPGTPRRRADAGRRHRGGGGGRDESDPPGPAHPARADRGRDAAAGAGRAREAGAGEVRAGQAGPGRRRPQEHRLRDLSHQDRFAEHAHGHDGEARLHRLSRRQGRGPAPEGVAAGSPAYEAAKKQAHVLPKNTEVWRTSANPTHSYTAILQESQEFVRFVNPGDLRVARRTCGTGGCHPSEVAQVEKSMMTTGPMLWGAALYNNGGVPAQAAALRRELQHDGAARSGSQTVPPPTDEETVKKGVLPYLDPLPRFEVSQPGNVLRIFERGRSARPRSASPPLEERRASRPTGSASAASAPRTAPTRSCSACRRRACSTRRCLPRHQRPPRRLPLQRLHRLPRRLRQRPLAGALGPVRRSTATAG